MGSKTNVLLGLSFAIVLLICSEVAARDLAEQTSLVSNDKTESVKETNGVGKAKYDQGYGEQLLPPEYGHYGGGQGCPSYCPYGCCNGYGCCRAADVKTQVKPQN